MLLPCLLLPPSSSPHAHHALRLLCSTIHIPIPTTLSILDVWIFFIEICPSSHIPSPSATNLSAKKLLQQLKHSQSSGSKSLLKIYIFIDIVSEGTTFCFRLFVPIFGTHEHTHSGLLKGYLTQTGEFSDKLQAGGGGFFNGAEFQTSVASRHASLFPYRQCRQCPWAKLNVFLVEVWSGIEVSANARAVSEGFFIQCGFCRTPIGPT